MMDNVNADQFLTVVEDTASGLHKTAGLFARELLESVPDGQIVAGSEFRTPEYIQSIHGNHIFGQTAVTGSAAGA